MARRDDDGISFDLEEAHVAAIEELAGGRQVRLSGRVVDRRLRVDFVACNAAFTACNASFIACNAAFDGA